MRPAIYVYICCALLLSACTSPHSTKDHAPKTVPAQQVQIANPASVYCVQQSGKLRLERTTQGERMWCLLPDGREVEEWDYFRAQHPAQQP